MTMTPPSLSTLVTFVPLSFRRRYGEVREGRGGRGGRGEEGGGEEGGGREVGGT